TLLKLATGYRKDGKYQESLDALKRLRRKQPRLSGVRREFQHALAQTLDGLLGGWMKKGAYENIVNLYLEERDLFDLIESPAPMLTVARASMQLGLEEFALEVFRRADPLLQDHEKPADLLISLGRESLKKGRLEKALAMADLIIKNHPGDMLVPLAYQLKGRVLYQKGKYPPAGEMFASALGFNPALTAMASRTKALEALREADRMIKDCTLPSPHSYEEMARLYHDLGNPRKAISILYREIDKKAGEDRARVMFMIARYYEALGNREKSNEIFKQILNGKSPFWSILARERLEEAAFDKELGK
ncbi:MAG: tetratricopeptide repeat protein, partial [Deltaproteobacteria bacterium]|nr:tetratricopeptide repeat protein [Deltaproteobacteria bacterium]